MMFTPAKRVCHDHLHLLKKYDYYLIDKDGCVECLKKN